MINEAKRQQFEAKKEYEVVTSYLADIQKIDLLPERAKKSVDDMARKLLVETDKPCLDICYECGFNSERNFERCFKKITGFYKTFVKLKANKPLPPFKNESTFDGYPYA